MVSTYRCSVTADTPEQIFRLIQTVTELCNSNNKLYIRAGAAHIEIASDNQNAVSNAAQHLETKGLNVKCVKVNL